MKKSLLFIAALFALISCGNGAGNQTETEAEAAANTDSLNISKEQRIMEQLANLPAEPVFDITTTLGTIRVRLYSDTPKHRENFAKLALSGFYDRLLFHRVIPGFMIQGGDPLTISEDNKASFGTGGPGYTIPAEILPNHNHKKGALAAARRGDAANPYRESSGSQFYIVQDPGNCAQLDGQYTVFGETIEGLDIVDKIAQVATDYRDCPTTPVRILAVKPVEQEN